ncbi:MAG: hypothetical protein P8M79_05860, partial [Alphaproteobacteria bacterium]|nr:hypothetical protein [Alphaproteobacteria bacterium]
DRCFGETMCECCHEPLVVRVDVREERGGARWVGRKRANHHGDDALGVARGIRGFRLTHTDPGAALPLGEF